MKEYICDLCHKKITPADIRISFEIEVENKKKEKVDMHSACYYKFMAYAKKELTNTEE